MRWVELKPGAVVHSKDVQMTFLLADVKRGERRLGVACAIHAWVCLDTGEECQTTPEEDAVVGSDFTVEEGA